MDNIRAAWNIKFPYEVERVDSDPEEDPVVTARKAAEAKRAEEAKKAAEEARKKTEEAKKRAEEKQAEEAAAKEEAAKELDTPTDPDDFEEEPEPEKPTGEDVKEKTEENEEK